MKKNSLIVGINSGYVHSNLAIRLLARASGVPFCEYNINMQKQDILPGLCEVRVLFFSCYIWNISYIYSIIDDIKAINEDTVIVLGGPCVSFEAKKIIKEHSAIDYIVVGEGEDIIASLLCTIEKGEPPRTKSVVYRHGESIAGDDSYNLVNELKCLPYEKDMVYFESSRGCPFSCSYCLSGYLKGVRYYDMDDVKASLTALSKMNVSIVKFVDRTFNANNKRCKEILSHILTLDSSVKWHFEIAGDLLDEQTIDLLNRGNFQVEIGIQSFNEETLKAVHRFSDLEKLEDNIKRLKIHKHIDLIAGLPYEDFTSFKESFNRAYALKADMLQLGFLKVLPGSELRNEKRITYSKWPPYTVLKTDWLSSYELFELQCIEKVLDVYTAENRFTHSLEFLLAKSDSAYSMFDRLSRELGDNIYTPIGYTKAIENMYRAYRDEEFVQVLAGLMDCDYHMSGAKGKKPDCLPNISYIKKNIRKKLDLSKDEDFFVTNIDYTSKKQGLFAVKNATGEVIEIGEEND